MSPIAGTLPMSISRTQSGHTINIGEAVLNSRRCTTDTLVLDGYPAYKTSYVVDNSHYIFMIIVYRQLNADNTLEAVKMTIIEFSDHQLLFTSSRIQL
jgi:hypothetical protein